MMKMNRNAVGICLLGIIIAACIILPRLSQANQNPRAVSMPGSQRMSPQERDFLTKLGQSVKDEVIANRINSITESMSTALKLEKTDYDFLVLLSQQVNNPTISGILAQIAERYRP